MLSMHIVLNRRKRENDKYSKELRELLLKRALVSVKWVLVSAVILANTQTSFAQEEFRSLSGELHLDVGVADQDLNLRITVRNHSFVVIFPILILRPITSQASDTVVMTAGSASTSYSISQIIEAPVDYTIQVECLACQNTIPTQYYSPSGNRLGLAGGVYIDPANLPAALSMGLLSRAKIAGEIKLANNVVSERNLLFTVSAVDTENSNFIYQSINQLVLAQGETAVDYAFSGLDRSVNGGYRIEVRCTNCFGASAQPQFSDSLQTLMQNYQAINFEIIDLPHVPIPAIIELLL